MEYAPGQKLKLNEEGLKFLCRDNPKTVDKLKRRLYVFKKLDIRKDYWKNPCLLVERIEPQDGKYLESWSPRFLEPAEKEK